MQILHQSISSALYRLKRRGLPYQYDLNPYSGCSHQCAYCYSLSKKSAPNQVIAKSNIAEILDQELSQAPLASFEIINIGGSCDAYQQAEKALVLMRDILNVCIKHRVNIIISTKSDLILRDFDLIDQLAQTSYVNIAACITSLKPEVSKMMEPGANLPEDRIRILAGFEKSKAHHALHFFPILPGLSDKEEQLEEMVSIAARHNVCYMMSAMLYLSGAIKNRYCQALKEHYPELLSFYQELYRKGSANKSYKAKIHGFLKSMREKYGVNSSYSQFLPRKK